MDSGSLGGGVGEVTPVDHALDALVTGLEHLVKVVEDGGLDHYDDQQLIGFVAAFERFRNRLPLVDHRVVTDCASRRVADAFTQPSLVRVLVSALRISSAEAHRRVKAAEAVGSRSAMTGEALPPRRPVLAAAQRAGDVTPEQVHIIQRALDGVDRRGFDPADIAAGEQLLTVHAATFEPKQLAQLADRVVAAIDPDGSLPDDRLNADRRHFTLQPTKDGAWVGKFRLTGALGAKLSAILKPLARPRIDHPAGAGPDGINADGASADADGAGAAGAGPMPATATVDGRNHGQRMHDALEDACDRLLRSDTLPDSGGTPATVIVTITLDELLAQLGYGRTTDGTLLSTAEVLDLAAQADIIPAVLNSTGAVLDLGRARRIATPAQTCALYARDGGCSFPGCDRPPEFCERHHIVAWIDGGLTNLNNLTLLCRYHHHQFADRGWTVTINPDGLPEWTPPAWIDPQQRPWINTRIHLAQLTRQTQPPLVRPSRSDPAG